MGMITIFLVSLLCMSLVASGIISIAELGRSGIIKTIIICSAIVICITSIAGFIEIETYKEEISTYKVTKYTYEIALQDEDLTGLERLNIVQSIIEKNEWLAHTQYYASRWYGFHLPREILELEQIKIKEKKYD